MCKDIKQRKNYFPKNFKRKALIEFVKGEKPNKIFEEFGVKKGRDKKYAVKLLHKWKKEFYKNTKILAMNFSNIDLDYAEKEINSIGNDEEEQGFWDEILNIVYKH